MWNHCALLFSPLKPVKSHVFFWNLALGDGYLHAHQKEFAVRLRYDPHATLGSVNETSRQLELGQRMEVYLGLLDVEELVGYSLYESYKDR